MKKAISILLILISYSAFAQNEIDERVSKMLSGMTLEQKIGQLQQIDGRTDLEKVKDAIRKGNMSSIMNICDPIVTDELQKIALEESPAGIPLIFARDVIHGFNTLLPIPLGQAASFDDELLRKAARNTALEATQRGIRWAFAPMMDIARDPRWGRIAEGFGEDTYLAGRLAVSVVLGYQGDNLSDETSMAACAKHFVGYGAAEGGRDYNTTYIPFRALYDTYFPPFKKCVDAGIASFMTSFNDNDGIPATGNHWLLTEVLREQWGFDGAVVSDWGSVGGMIPHGFAENKKEAAEKGIEAGCDMDMMSYSYINNLKELIENGAVDTKVLDQAVGRILKLKIRLGLFEHPYARKAEKSDVYSEEVLATACRLAEESVVMLKNENGALPIGKNAKTIVVTGPMADAPYDQLGTWALDGDKTRTITPINAIRKQYGDKYNIVYIPVLAYPRDENTEDMKSLVKAARKADVVLAFVGEEQIMSGEAHSLSNLHLQGHQTALLDAVSATGTTLVTVIMAGRPLVIPHEAEISSALLYAWHPGTMGGEALANIIFGKANPSGKLPVTFPRNEGQIPIYYNHKHTSHIAKGKEGDLNKIGREIQQSVMGHTSSYLDVAPTPLFVFGYGLSYSTFDYSNLSVADNEITADENIVISIDITNTGSVEGTEIVQFYTGRKTASVTRPMKELKGYVRVSLKPGEKRTIKYEIPVEELAFCMPDLQMQAEPGKYSLTVGPNSSDGLQTSFSIIESK